MLQVAHRHVQQVVHVAGQRMAGDHLVPAVDAVAERRDRSAVVVVQLHAHEGLQPQAEPLGLEQRPVSGDHALALEPLHPAQAGRRRQLHAFRQLGVGLPARALQLGKDEPVGPVEGDGRHQDSSRVCTQQHCASPPMRRNNASRLRANPASVGRIGTDAGSSAMNMPKRVEHQMTDKGYVPVYTTAVVEQPWSSYSETDHSVWARLFERQRALLAGRASSEFLDAMAAMEMSPDRIPKFDELNPILRKATGWELIGVEGLLPELAFFDHLANRRFPVTWWIRKPEQMDYLSEPDLFHDLFGHVPLLMNPVFADYMEAYGRGGVKAHGVGEEALVHLTRLY